MANVTPDMVKAGVHVYEAWEARYEHSEAPTLQVEKLVADLYQAMCLSNLKNATLSKEVQSSFKKLLFSESLIDMIKMGNKPR